MALYSHSLHYSGPRCCRCRRPLTDPDSIRRGIGPECATLQGKDLAGDLCVRDQFADVLDNAVPFSDALVLKRQPHQRARMFADPLDPGECVTNIPHLVVHHSPNGFEYGYGGSGPSDLALNVCQLYLNMTGYEGQKTACYDGACFSLAFSLHHEFKSAFIANARKSGEVIPFERINAWFQSHITSDLLEQYSLQSIEE